MTNTTAICPAEALPVPTTTCTGQCHGCAYKAGAAANLESHNFLRGVFAALGGYPFMCHESLGWTPGKSGYDPDTMQALVILSSKKALLRAGANGESLEKQVGRLRGELRLCGGWKAAVRRLSESGWFTQKDVRLVRRHYARHAAACLERLTQNPEVLMPDDRRDRKLDLEDIEEAIQWFFNEARESGTKIGWLFRGETRGPSRMVLNLSLARQWQY